MQREAGACFRSVDSGPPAAWCLRSLARLAFHTAGMHRGGRYMPPRCGRRHTKSLCGASPYEGGCHCAAARIGMRRALMPWASVHVCSTSGAVHGVLANRARVQEDAAFGSPMVLAATAPPTQSAACEYMMRRCVLSACAVMDCCCPCRLIMHAAERGMGPAASLVVVTVAR